MHQAVCSLYTTNRLLFIFFKITDAGELWKNLLKPTIVSNVADIYVWQKQRAFSCTAAHSMALLQVEVSQVIYPFMSTPT